jgi:chromosome segregation ATPase
MFQFLDDVKASVDEVRRRGSSKGGSGTPRSGGDRALNTPGSGKASRQASPAANHAIDIPKEELMHLSMKLSKKLKSLETSHRKLTEAKNKCTDRCHGLEDILCDIFVCTSLEETPLEEIKRLWLETGRQKNRTVEINDETESRSAEETEENRIVSTDLEVAREQLAKQTSLARELRQELFSVRQSIRESNDDSRNNDTFLKDYQRKLVASEEKVIYLQLKTDSMRNEMKEVEEAKKKLSTEYESVCKSFKALQERNTQQAASIRVATEERDALHQTITQIRAQLKDAKLLDAEKAAVILAMHEKMSERNVQSRESALDQTTQELLSVQRDLAAKVLENTSLTNRLREASKAVSEAVKDTEGYRRKLNEAQTREVEARSIIARLQNNVDLAHAASREAAEDIEAAQIAKQESTLLVEKSKKRQNDLLVSLTKALSEKEDWERKNAALEVQVSTLIAERDEAVHSRDSEIEVLRNEHSELVNEQKEKMKLDFDKEIEKSKLASQRKSSQAIRLVQEKDAELVLLKKQIGNLKTEVESGRPEERKILEYAADQARRESMTRAVQSECDALKKELKSAKDRIIALERQAREWTISTGDSANIIPAEGPEVSLIYLQNVILRFMSFQEGSSERLRLIPVIATILSDINTRLSLSS